MPDFTGHGNQMSVPQFGTWDGKTDGQTNYSMVFSQARANRKKHKGELIEPHSLRNEKELLKQLLHNQDSTHSGKHENCMSVSQFGARDGKTEDQTSYPVLLSQAHDNWENHKIELVAPHTLGNEKDLLEQQQQDDDVANPSMHGSWLSVPQFGGWDGKTKNQTNYSEVFLQARANRKNHKSVLPRNLGNERELLKQQLPNDNGTDANMHDNKMSVSQFGALDGKTKDQANDPASLSQAPDNWKNDKSAPLAPCSLGNEREHLEQQLSSGKSKPLAPRRVGNEREQLEQQLHTDNGRDVGMHDNLMSGAYPMLLTQAHADKDNHNIKLVVSCSLGNERELLEQQHHHDNGADAGMNNLMSLPQFGAWDGKAKDQLNYSVVFSQARANRKKYKNELTVPRSLGSERELLNQQQHFHDSYPVTHAGEGKHGEKKRKRKKSPSCFGCFFFF